MQMAPAMKANGKKTSSFLALEIATWGNVSGSAVGGGAFRGLAGPLGLKVPPGDSMLILN